MKSNKIIAAIALLLFSVTIVFAQKSSSVDAKLESATVYKKGATLSHSVNAKLPAGTSELVINNIADYIQEGSIKVNVPVNVEIVSMTFGKPRKDVKFEETLEYKEKNKLIKDAVLALINSSNLRIGLEDTLNFIKQNLKKIDDDKMLSSLEHAQKRESYLEKQAQYEKQLLDLQLGMTKQQEQLETVQTQLSDYVKKGMPTGGKLILQLRTNKTSENNIEMFYFTENASWKAAYQINVANLSSPMKFAYNCSVQQNTGLNWRNIELIMSMEDTSLKDSAINTAPLIIINGEVYTGKLSALNPGNVSSMDVLKDANSIAKYGAKGKNGVIIIKMKKGAELEKSPELKDRVLEPILSTFLSNNLRSGTGMKNVFSKEFNLNANYHYYASPKLFSEVVLVATEMWMERVNLLPGVATAYFENKQTNKFDITPVIVKDTAALILAAEKSIIVKREKLKNASSTEDIGNNTKQILTYEISVKNEKKEAVDFELEEKYSNSKEVTVITALLDSGNASLSKNGSLTWRMKLNPGESRTVRFSYSLFYPKGKIIEDLEDEQ